MTAQVPHILVVGGGYVGMYTAYGLRRAARRGKIRVTVVDPRSVMTYQPFLPEAAAGSVEPRHVVVPLRKTLKGCRVVTGRVTGIDHARQGREGDARGGPGLRARLRPDRGRARLDRPDAADPRAGRGGDRVQERRRGDRPAQQGAGPARRRVVPARPGAAQVRADLRLHRRWVRRCRGVRGARGHGPLRHPVLRQHQARGHALGAGRGDQPDPARGRRGARPVHRRASSASATWTSSWRPGWSPARRAM